MEPDLSCLRLQHPFRLLAVGASASGKTMLFDYIIKNQKTVIGNLKGSGVIDRLIICFAVQDPIFSGWCDKAPVCVYHKGLPTSEDLENGLLIKNDCNNLIVLEDLDHRESHSEMIHRLFTMYSHHYSCSVLYSQHNLFLKHKNSVLINRNSNYLALMQNVWDKAAIRILASQTHPGKGAFLIDAFKQATENNGADDQPAVVGKWLLCDFTPNCPEKFRYRETICWPTDRVIYYVPAEDSDDKTEGKKDSKKKTIV